MMSSLSLACDWMLVLKAEEKTINKLSKVSLSD